MRTSANKSVDSRTNRAYNINQGVGIMDNTYTTKQIAEILKVTVNTVKLWLKNGKLKGMKGGKSWYITKDDLKEVFPEWAFTAFADTIDQENQKKLVVKVYGNDYLYKALYPEEYERDQLNSYHPDPWDVYHEQCEADLDRRFPYPWVGDEVVHEREGYNCIRANDPEAFRGFYWSKHKEEELKLSRLMQTLKDKHGVSDEDIAEIKRTYENLQLLKIGQLMYDI